MPEKKTDAEIVAEVAQKLKDTIVVTASKWWMADPITSDQLYDLLRIAREGLQYRVVVERVLAEWNKDELMDNEAMNKLAEKTGW